VPRCAAPCARSHVPGGNDILIATGADLPLAAAHLLGADISTVIGSERMAELLARWPGDVDLLIRELDLYGAPSRHSEPERRRQLLEALTRGLEVAAP
jgi:hypothetical protein